MESQLDYDLYSYLRHVTCNKYIHKIKNVQFFFAMSQVKEVFGHHCALPCI